MLRYLRGADLHRHARLSESMFRDRAWQFHDRLGWAVEVDRSGAERDEYDTEQSLYVIWETPGGWHGGSMRFLPTTGATMLSDHFSHLAQHTRIASPFIWETTRFCITPQSRPRVSAALMLGGLELGLHYGLSHAVGVFDARMIRIYERLGWPPAILGSEGSGRDAISAGLWAFEPDLRAPLLARAEVSAELSAHWLRRSLGRLSEIPKAA